MTYPYEREASRGEPLPDGAGWVDTVFHQGFTWLYSRYRAGMITKEQGHEEKGRLLYQYDMAKRRENGETQMCQRFAQLIKDAETASWAYAKERTPENADALYERIYGTLEKFKT